MIGEKEQVQRGIPVESNMKTAIPESITTKMHKNLEGLYELNSIAHTLKSLVGVPEEETTQSVTEAPVTIKELTQETNYQIHCLFEKLRIIQTTL